MLFDNPVPQEIIRPAGSPHIRGDWRVTQPFGSEPKSLIYDGEPKRNGVPFHRGIDLGDGRCGTPILAPADAIIRFEGRLTNGEIIALLNFGGGWGSVLGHLSRTVVSDGERVKAGEKIGEEGATGYATGCHLHWSVKRSLPKGWGWRDFVANASGGRGDTAGRGIWVDPWPRLRQNVTIRFGAAAANIRTEPGAGGTSSVFATSSGGRILRAEPLPDGTALDLGASSEWRPWGGTVQGGRYSIGGVASTQWERIFLDGAWRYVASLLVELSQT